MKKWISILYALIKNLILSIHTTVICLIVLCILVLWGTLFQIDNGIYAAQSRFFNSWIVRIWGFFPFPGVRSTILVLILNQLAILAFRQKWRLDKAGLVLTHIGVLVLLIGGGIISFIARESFLTLREGESSNESTLYHTWEIAVWKTSGAVKDTAVFGMDSLVDGRIYPVAFANGAITIKGVFINCIALTSPVRVTAESTMQAAIDSLEPQQPASNPLENIPGAVVLFTGKGLLRQRVFLYAENPEPSYVALGADTLWLTLRLKRQPLPVTITLIDFVKEDYAGTQMARQYKSAIHVKGAGIDRDVVVSMNKPFRYRHHTFYQSSYSQNGARESSTFAVVKNRGKLLPYIAGLFMALGLIMHFCLKLVVHIRKQPAVET
jgi:hypothetical protein